MAKDKKKPRPEVWPITPNHDVEYDDDALEFLKEVDRFKTATGIRHLSWHDAFLIARELGYRKVAEPTELPKCVNGMTRTTAAKINAAAAARKREEREKED